MAYDMNADMKAKYTSTRSMTSQPYHPRTGNTHHSDHKPQRPCHAAPAGAKTFQPDKQKPLPGVRTLVWDMQAGARKFEWCDGHGHPIDGFKGDAALAALGLS